MNKKNEKDKKNKKDIKSKQTFTKRCVSIILFFSILDVQLSYLLAFIGRVDIAETLSVTVVTEIIGVCVAYFLKSFLETFAEKREKRLAGKTDDSDSISDEEIEG